MKKSASRKNESGNVMFYILIAIALLAALSFAISQSGRGSVSDVTADRQRLLVAEILDYADTVKKSVQILRLRGVAFSRLDFDVPALAGYDNASCTTDECLIFNVNGGGAVYKQASSSATVSAADWIFTAANEVEEIGTTAGAASGADLLMVLTPVKREICLALNVRLGIANNGAGGDAPDDAEIDLSIPFTGTASYSKTLGDEAGATKLGPGHNAACFKDGASGNYIFYQVLLPR